MWWKGLSKWTAQSFDAATLQGRVAASFPNSQTFSSPLLVCFPHSPANIPQHVLWSCLFHLSALSSKWDHHMNCALAALAALTLSQPEGLWKVRGWGLAGWAQQTLWSSSHMSAGTRKDGWSRKCSHPFTPHTDACYTCVWRDPQLTTLVMDEVLHAWLRSHTFHTVFVGGDWTSSGVVRQAPKAQRVSTQHNENGYVTTASLLQTKGHEPNFNPEFSLRVCDCYGFYYCMYACSVTFNTPVTPEKVLFGAADVGSCSLLNNAPLSAPKGQ